jgi:5-methylcytosine-specific restriction endonuclease McrA
MPIKPENRALYPGNWKVIRAAILERAGDRCERCGLRNGAVGHRAALGAFVEHLPGDLVVFPDGVSRTIRIVLTVAHIENPDPRDCRPENLQALCQQCHNRHDAQFRARNAATTRRRRREAVQPALFGCEEQG